MAIDLGGDALLQFGQMIQQRRERQYQDLTKLVETMRALYGQVPPDVYQKWAKATEQRMGRGQIFPRQQQPVPGTGTTGTAPAGSPQPGFGAFPGVKGPAMSSLPGLGQIPGAAGGRPAVAPQMQATDQIAQPRQPLGSTMVSDWVKDPKQMEKMKQLFPGIDQATVEEANQNYPEWRYYLRAGAQGTSGQTIGDVIPGLRNDPRAKDLVNQPVPQSALITDPKNPNFMQPDIAKLSAYVRVSLEGQPTSTQTAELDLRKAQPLIAQAKTLEGRATNLYNQAVKAFQTNPKGAQGLWSSYWKAVDDYNAYVKQHPETQMQPIEHQTFSEAGVAGMGASALAKEQRATETAARTAAHQKFVETHTKEMERLANIRLDLYRERTRKTGAGPSFSQPTTITDEQGKVHQIRYISKKDGSEGAQEYLNGHWQDVPVTRLEALTGERTPSATVPSKVDVQNAVNNLNAVRDAFGPSSPNFQQAAADYIRIRMNAGGSYDDAVHQVQVSSGTNKQGKYNWNPTNQPKGAPTTQLPKGTPSGGQGVQPGTPGTKTLTSYGQQAFTIYQQSKHPIPKDIWQKIPAPDQQLLTQQGVPHE